jgi:trehalose 6-phosphate synthase/phosphatase
LKWVGVPNTTESISKDEQDDYEELMLEHDCVPVFLRPELADKFFNQFCKGVMWPMLHVRENTHPQRTLRQQRFCASCAHYVLLFVLLLLLCLRVQYVLPQSNSQFSAKWDEMWQAYTAANALFASVVSHCVDTPTDTIFIHNYHLLLLPSFLRTKLPRAKIGLFIHTVRQARQNTALESGECRNFRASDLLLTHVSIL